MIIKQIIEEDFINYKKPSMFIAFPNCSWKCDIESGKQVCQNGALAKTPNIKISVDEVICKYIDNPITSAIVIGGLEPFDDFEQLKTFVEALRIKHKNNDDVVIYTGYYPEEIQEFTRTLKSYKNIIVKFGRFIPNRMNVYDEILGVTLVSENQFAVKIS